METIQSRRVVRLGGLARKLGQLSLDRKAQVAGVAGGKQPREATNSLGCCSAWIQPSLKLALHPGATLLPPAEASDKHLEGSG